MNFLLILLNFQNPKMRVGFLLLFCVFGPQCTNQTSVTPPVTVESEPPPCPVALPAPHFLPGTRPEHRDVGYWISNMSRPDELILTRNEIDELNTKARGISENPAGLGARFLLLQGQSGSSTPAIKGTLIIEQMQKGIERHRERTKEGKRVFLNGDRPPDSFFSNVEEIQTSAENTESFHLITELTELRCHPDERGIYEYEGDVDFDLFLCSTLRPGEVIRTISEHESNWILVRSFYATGWITRDQLGPRLTEEEVVEYVSAEDFVVVTSDRTPIWASPDRRTQIASVRIGLHLPIIGDPRDELIQVVSPSEQGLRPGFIDARSVHIGFLPMTRRNVFTYAFAQLDDAFGWAGAGGDRDCSRFLMDLFALFGLEIPRNSYFQSRSGSFSIDVSEMSTDEKRRIMDESLGDGVAFLFLPGHIMLLVGRDVDRHFAIHQFSGYRVACRSDQDTKMVVDRLSITDLRLGSGSQRRSFIERLTAITVFGRNPR